MHVDHRCDACGKLTQSSVAAACGLFSLAVCSGCSRAVLTNAELCLGVCVLKCSSVLLRLVLMAVVDVIQVFQGVLMIQVVFC